MWMGRIGAHGAIWGVASAPQAEVPEPDLQRPSLPPLPHSPIYWFGEKVLEGSLGLLCLWMGEKPALSSAELGEAGRKGGCP